MTTKEKEKGFALSQLPERFQSKFDTDWERIDGQKFFVKGLKDSPRFPSLKEAHRYIESLETGPLAKYIHRKYGHYGYKRNRSIEYNQPFTPEYTNDHYRWVENVTDGLRRVGLAHTLVRMNHTGWYADNYQEQLVHGVVYQMPSRNGKPMYIPAVDNEDNEGCACLDFSSTTDDKEDAARWADSMAEKWAESEREYRAKDDQERRLEEIGEEIKELYTEFRQVARELRANCDKVAGVEVVRELVRKEWKRTKAAIHKLRAERERVEEYGVEY